MALVEKVPSGGGEMDLVKGADPFLPVCLLTRTEGKKAKGKN